MRALNDPRDKVAQGKGAISIKTSGRLVGLWNGWYGIAFFRAVNFRALSLKLVEVALSAEFQDFLQDSDSEKQNNSHSGE